MNMKDQPSFRAGVPGALSAGRGFYLSPDEGGQGDPDPNGAGTQPLSAEALNAVNAAITARLKDAGMGDIKTGMQSIQDTLKGLTAGQGNAGADGGGSTEPEHKPGSSKDMIARLEALERENKQLRELGDKGNSLLQEQNKRKVLSEALVAAGVPAGSTQLRDGVNALMAREDIKPTGRTTVEGDAVWEGTVDTQAGPNPNGAIGDVVGGFLRDRQYLLPPVNAGGVGAGDGVVPAGSPGGRPVPIGEMTPEQLAGLNPEQLDQLWAEGGGKPFGQPGGLYGAPSVPQRGG